MTATTDPTPDDFNDDLNNDPDNDLNNDLNNDLSNIDSFYVTDGIVAPDAPSYAIRQTDTELVQHLKEGDFCYILEAHQTGKSSLGHHARHQLRAEGFYTVYLDLKLFVGQHVTSEQWYHALLTDIGDELLLSNRFENFWKANTHITPLRRLFAAIRWIAVERLPGNLVIFLDDIEATRDLPFSTDEFFAALRGMYVWRAADPPLARLTFCLLGTIALAELMHDAAAGPFDVATRITLRDHTLEEIAPLARGLGEQGEQLLARVHYWTNGHPAMTQRLCHALQQRRATTTEEVDEIVQTLFLSEQARQNYPLIVDMGQRLSQGNTAIGTRLDLYRWVLSDKKVEEEQNDPLFIELRLSGAVASEGGALRIRNRITSTIYDKAIPSPILTHAHASFGPGCGQ